MGKKLGNFGVQITIGLIAGIILGLIARNIGWLGGTLSWLGDTYVQLLKVMIAPLIFTAVVTSIANLRQVTNAARLAAHTLIWFAVTAFLAVTSAIILGILIQPGVGASVDASAAQEPATTGSWLGFLNSVIPSNILGLGAKLKNGSVALDFNALQLIVISMAIGIAALKAGKPVALVGLGSMRGSERADLVLHEPLGATLTATCERLGLQVQTEANATT